MVGWLPDRRACPRQAEEATDRSEGGVILTAASKERPTLGTVCATLHLCASQLYMLVSCCAVGRVVLTHDGTNSASPAVQTSSGWCHTEFSLKSRYSNCVCPALVLALSGGRKARTAGSSSPMS